MNKLLLIIMISLVGCSDFNHKRSVNSTASYSDPRSGVFGTSDFGAGGKAEPAKPAPVDISQMLEIKEDQDKIELVIRAEIKTPIFVKRDKSYVVKDISKICFDEFQDMVLITVPKSNFFVNHHLNNPFAKIEGISSVASIWGKKVSFEDAAHDAVIIRIGEEFKDYEISKLVGDDLNNEFQKNTPQKLGQGAKGSVSSVTYQDKKYALKQQKYELKSSEYFDMSRLFFTDAVAGVFGDFLSKDQENLIMQLGQSFEKAKKLDLPAVLDAVERFIGLAHAQKKLDINNIDIKMENTILVDGRPMVIDIDKSGRTEGYSGTAPQLLARVLLENQLERRLKIVPDEEVVSRYLNGSTSKDEKDVWPFFLSYACTDLLNKTAADCKEITKDKLPNLYQEIIKAEKQLESLRTTFNKIYGNNKWEMDVWAGFVHYDTSLAIPQSATSEALSSVDYWAQKEKIINGYCSAISKTGLSIDLGEKYICKSTTTGEDTKWTIANAPTKTTDTNYAQWLRDMFEPIIYARVLQAMHKKYWNNDLVPFILKNYVDTEIATPILKLYNTKP